MNSVRLSQLRDLPSLHEFLRTAEVQTLATRYGVAPTTECAREVLANLRQQIRVGKNQSGSTKDLARILASALEGRFVPSLVPIINATGVILHTNLGRAPLSAKALDAVSRVAQGYSTLEYSLERGTRCNRYQHCRVLLQQLTQAQDATVVNNNAAAMLLILATFCREREVIISRSQLLEIGGGFRIPDILVQSGAKLVEIGTTNRTYVSDYEGALTPETAAILVVHASNFRQTGFVHHPSLSELVTMVADHNRNTDGRVKVIHDLGSGLLRDECLAFQGEFTVERSIREGAHLTAFSGDKLLGGPQAGIIAGEQALIARLLHHPLMRVLRVDKMVLAALSATLESYLRECEIKEVPVLAMGSLTVSQLRLRAVKLADSIRKAGIPVSVVEAEAAAGGGSLPQQPIQSVALALELDPLDARSAQLRAGQPPVVSRIADGQLLLDLRTVLPEQDLPLLQAVLALSDSSHG